MKKTGFIITTMFLMFFAACGGESNNDNPGAVTISIAPATENVAVGASKTFTVKAQNTDFAVSVSPVSGLGCVKSGNNAVICTPVAAGTYSVTVTATTDTSKSASATVVVSESNQPPGSVLENEYNTISASGLNAMAIRTDGSLWAWGYNFFGQLGDGTNTDRKTPVKIMDSVASVSANKHAGIYLGDGNTSIQGYSLAIRTDGSLWAWGWNGYGQLGDETDIDRNTPVKIMDDVVSVSAGEMNAMAVRTDGSLWAWGYGGQLGDGTIIRNKPEKIMDSVASVSEGRTHTTFVKTDGSLWTWGENAYGGLGDGTNTRRDIPVKIMDDVASVSSGWYHAIAVKTDGSLWAWGHNHYGQLGDGTNIDRNVPVKIMDGVMLPTVVSYAEKICNTLRFIASTLIMVFTGNDNHLIG